MTALYTLSKLQKYFWLQLQMQPLIINIIYTLCACMYVCYALYIYRYGVSHSSNNFYIIRGQFMNCINEIFHKGVIDELCEL